MKDEKVKYLSLEHKRYKNYGECSHDYAIVDEELNEITCLHCNKKLNPIKYLAKLADKEGAFYRKHVELREAHAKLLDKTRCKCQNCGQMTRIDKSMPPAPLRREFKPEVVKK